MSFCVFFFNQRIHGAGRRGTAAVSAEMVKPSILPRVPAPLFPAPQPGFQDLSSRSHLPRLPLPAPPQPEHCGGGGFPAAGTELALSTSRLIYVHAGTSTDALRSRHGARGLPGSRPPAAPGARSRTYVLSRPRRYRTIPRAPGKRLPRGVESHLLVT